MTPRSPRANDPPRPALRSLRAAARTPAVLLWAVLALAAVVPTVVPTAAGAASSTRYGVKTESYNVKTKYGDVYVEVARPTDPRNPKRVVKGPAIFTYSPYSILWVGLFGSRTYDAQDWVPQGYVRVWADVVGTGNSGGCWDYGGRAEKVTAHRLVEWIAKQPWSSGKVGMIGGSYEGTTAWAAAVTQPPHLTTVVPEAAIARWYDYAFSGGIRYSDNNEGVREGPEAQGDEGVDTPLAFDFGLAIPPPLDAQDPDWGQKVREHVTPCDQLEHTEYGYDQTPDYGRFWRERDYLRDASRIRIPVLIAANWGDWNVKQEESILMYRAIRNSPSKHLYMGNSFRGHGVPGGRYESVVHEWMDHWLLGVDNGIQNLPAVTSQTSSYDSTGDAKGGWRAGAWPTTTNVVLYAQETPVTTPDDYKWKLLPWKFKPLRGMPREVAQFPSSNVNTESHAAHHARNDHDWFWFEAPPFKRDVRVFGSIKVQVYLDTARRWITLTPSVVEVTHASHRVIAGQHVGTDPKALSAVTRGWLDSRYRDGLAKEKLLPAGKPFQLTVDTKPTDYTFERGHWIGVNIQTEINEWSIPKPYPCDSPDCVLVTVDWTHARTRLILPVVGPVGDPRSLFDFRG